VGIVTGRAYPFKRPPRPRRDTYEKPNHLEVLEALLAFEPLYEWADLLDAKTSGVGRPRVHPPVVALIFAIMAWDWGGLRATAREIRHPAAWGLISEHLSVRYPERRCFQAGGNPMSRFQYSRFRDRYCIDEDTLQDLATLAMEAACEQAQRMGQVVESAGGSLTHPSPQRIGSGDGTVLKLRYGAVPGSRQLNSRTGELEVIRHDPDADDYTTGDGRFVRGHKFVLFESRNGYEDERVLLGVEYQPNKHPGGEAAVAIALIRRVRPLVPGMQGVAWDKALRGKHIEELYELGLQPIIKVALEEGGKSKSRRIGPHRVSGCSDAKVEVYARAGAVGIQVPVGGENVFVKCTPVRRMLRKRRGGTCWYNVYEIPNKAPVPLRLRRGRVTVRLNGQSKDDPFDLTRSEIIRPIAETDREWKALYAPRPGSEATNSWFKARLPNGRCPAVGAPRTRFEMLSMQLFANLRALIAFERRTGKPSP
jgi:hypothetical protein